MITPIDKTVSLEQLILDPNNYRLLDEKVEAEILDKDAEKELPYVLKSMELQQLGVIKDSILSHGFLEMERIVIRPLKTDSNSQLKEEEQKYIVVEGNRRTAALMSLLALNKKEMKEIEKIADPEEREKKKAEKTVPEFIINKSKAISVIFIDGTEKELQQYSATLMGLRHVSGPKKWDGFQSAKLINDLRADGHSFSKVGEILGITSREVGRRFRGYKAFVQMRKDPNYNDKIEPRHYGLLLEFLTATKKGRSWLNWNDDVYKFENYKNLMRVYKAITSDENKYTEIKNPTDARKFVSLLDTEYKQDIEEGEDIANMPDPKDFLKVGWKLTRINSFIDFIDKDFNSEETEQLRELLEKLTIKLGVES